ncbi:MAG: hypothetical protein ACR2NO_11430 [Chloroflexota bacterium]
MKREFVINRQGVDYVLYAGLLDEAHAHGLSSIRTQLVQAPTGQNGQVAICLAEVTTERGTFTGLGDASPENASRAMANALIRLAETRAKARALRDAINVNMMVVEELAETAPESLSNDGLVEREPLQVAAAAPRLMAVPSPAALKPVTPPTGHTLPPGVVPLDAARPRRIREVPPSNENGRGNGSGKPSVDAAPATPTQIETIAKLARSVGRPVPTNDLSRAAASELISRLSEERYRR